jgi:hypothetical protein
MNQDMSLSSINLPVDFRVTDDELFDRWVFIYQSYSKSKNSMCSYIRIIGNREELKCFPIYHILPKLVKIYSFYDFGCSTVFNGIIRNLEFIYGLGSY